MTALPEDVVADLRQENARLSAELDIARDRQNASAEILRTIAGMPGDAEHALNQIAETSARLFGAPSATIHIAEGDGWARTIRFGASSKNIGAGVPDSQLKIGGRNMPGTIVAENRQVHVPDLDNVDPAIADWPGLPYAREAGTRSMSGSPLRREGKAIGALIVYRDRLAPFTAEELAVQQTFADQAAIAIENARLFNETQVALSRQTATSDILRVISGSPTDVQPVFDAIVLTAVRLLRCDMAFFLRCHGSTFSQAALVESEGSRPVLDLAPVPIDPDANFPSRAIVSKKNLHLPDWSSIDLPDHERHIRETYGINSSLFLPLLRAGECVGVLAMAGKQANIFGESEIALAESFRDQALIAIENTRLFNETTEALERQTATADILKVIASSPTDVQPVFEAIAASANRLIGGFSATVMLFVDDVLQLVAFTPTTPTADEMLQASFPSPLAEFPPFELVRDGETVQFPDTESEDVPPLNRTLARSRGYRGMLFTPLMSKGAAIGILSVTRKEPGAFAAHHVQLLQTFADQAVIAIENARLFEEVQAKTRDLSEALQQQTATADVLKVISRSAFDLQAVFDTLLSSAVELSGAVGGTICVRDGDIFPYRATVGASPESAQFLAEHPATPGRHSTAGRVILSSEVVCIPDVLQDSEYRMPVVSLNNSKLNDSSSSRSLLGVPLLRDDRVEGALVLARAEPGLFDQRQIELVKTFADQAVIAIENVRLFDEVQARTRDLSEALTYQTGSSNILSVIASSPTDVGPVLKAIVESASELCEAYDAVVRLRDGDDLRLSAHNGPIPTTIDKLPINRNVAAGRAFLDKKPVHVHDLLSSEGDQFPKAREMSRLEGGHRTILSVPLLREGESIGAIVLRRIEVHPFSDKQIALLQTFADQAVIAIGNVRMFEQLQERTEDLRETLEFQTATSDVLKVISSSPDSLQPVLDVIVDTARHLCGTETSTIFLLRDEKFHIAAASGAMPEYLEFLRNNPIALHQAGSSTSRAAREKRTVHVPDIGADPEFGQGPMAVGQRRALLSVPLMREGTAIGVITMRQSHLTPFTERQIEVVQTFADQAVIAISNVRLFEEVQAKTRDLTEALTYQTGSSNILGVIASSPTDVGPVLKAIVESACELCGAYDAAVLLKDGDQLRFSAHHGPIPISFDKLPINRKWTAGRAFVDRTPVHVYDLLAEGDEFPLGQELSRRMGHRSILSVPLLREGESIGTIVLRRTEVHPFSDKQIALLQTFADQAVIAIGNVRLFAEVQERTRELSQSLEDLRTAQDRLVQTEKLASLGQLTAGIAHEIKNPLNFINNFAALSAELTDELNEVLSPTPLDNRIRAEVDEITRTLKDNLEKVVQHGKRADSIVKNMLLHSREGSGDHRPADINALLDESLNLAYHGARAEKREFNVTLQRDFDEMAGSIEVFPQELTRVFLNLIANGFYAVTKRKTDNGGSGFDPVLRATTRNRGDTVEIRIRDNGTGIPEDVKEKMFNPFFTTKPAGEGTGLGLSMSHDIIVKQHGGRIDVETEPGQFTEFTIVLPRISNHSSKSRGET